MEPGDVSALTRHLNALLASADLREQYGRAGREWVESRFSITAMVQGNLTVYQSLII